MKLGFSKVQHAINIDLSNLNSTNLDLDNNLVTVGAGVENARLYDLLSSVGKETGSETLSLSHQSGHMSLTRNPSFDE